MLQVLKKPSGQAGVVVVVGAPERAGHGGHRVGVMAGPVSCLLASRLPFSVSPVLHFSPSLDSAFRIPVPSGCSAFSPARGRSRKSNFSSNVPSDDTPRPGRMRLRVRARRWRTTTGRGRGSASMIAGVMASGPHASRTCESAERFADTGRPRRVWGPGSCWRIQPYHTACRGTRLPPRSPQ